MVRCKFRSLLILAVFLAFLPTKSMLQPLKNEVSTMNSTEFPPCPDSPNCVSSQAKTDKHFIDPLVYSGSGNEAFTKLKNIVAEYPGSRIIKSTTDTLHAEFRTHWLKFTDDFNAVLEDKTKTIQVRSASRIGYWDFGTNRKRIEKIRGAFLEDLK